MIVISAPRVSASFTDERLQRLIRIERSHFWFEGRRRLVQRLLAKHAGAAPAKLLDLGCGGGCLCEELASKGYDMTAADLLAAGLRRLQCEAPVVRGLQCTAENIPVRDAEFHTVLALDLLEHADDAQAARELARVLRPGGVAIVTVPAFAWLWSYRDDAAGHRRRYSSGDLDALLRRSGFRVEHLGYYQFVLFPLAVASRILARKSASVRDFEDMPFDAVNWVFSLVNRWEAELSRWFAWPWGSSLVAVGRKMEG